MEVLTVYREWQSSYSQTTILKDVNGKVKETYKTSINQPKKGLKSINIRGTTYALDWSNVPKRSEKGEGYTFGRKKYKTLETKFKFKHENSK